MYIIILRIIWYESTFVALNDLSRCDITREKESLTDQGIMSKLKSWFGLHSESVVNKKGRVIMFGNVAHRQHTDGSFWMLETRNGLVIFVVFKISSFRHSRPNFCCCTALKLCIIQILSVAILRLLHKKRSNFCMQLDFF